MLYLSFDLCEIFYKREEILNIQKVFLLRNERTK